MKKLLKRIVVVLSLSIVTNFNLNHTKVHAFGDTDIRQMLWLGRTGGNWDGLVRRLKLVYKFFDGDGYEITTETGYVHF